MSRRARSPTTPQRAFGGEDPCVMCLDRAPNIFYEPCRHVACSDCFSEYTNLKDMLEGKARCPSCRAPISGFKKVSEAELSLMSQQTCSQPSMSQTSQSSSQPAAPPTMAPSGPVPVVRGAPSVFCSMHGKECVLRRAAKNNRLYYSCERTGKGCFACYASGPTGDKDAGTPHCVCGLHAITRVSHTEKNPNRRFFTCGAAPGAKKCPTMCWAEGKN